MGWVVEGLSAGGRNEVVVRVGHVKTLDHTGDALGSGSEQECGAEQLSGAEDGAVVGLWYVVEVVDLTPGDDQRMPFGHGESIPQRLGAVVAEPDQLWIWIAEGA